MRKDIKIAWFGTPEISANVLKKLIENKYNICAVIAQPDKPIGRKKIIEKVPTKKVAELFNIPVYQPEFLKNDFDFIKQINPDLILTLAYGQIVPHDLLLLPKFGCLNLHGSLLPKYRGASPIQTSILNGDKITGVTLMEMVDKMDAGKMFYQEKIDINIDDNLDSLSKKIEDCCFNIIEYSLDKYINGELVGVVQKEDEVTYCKKIKAEDCQINFNDFGINIFNKFRALYSKPGSFFVYKGEKYNVNKIELLDNKFEPCKVYNYDKTGLYIGCVDKTICIKELQKPGKKMLNIKEFYNGANSLFQKNDIIQ